jgi:hypothetical protein
MASVRRTPVFSRRFPLLLALLAAGFLFSCAPRQAQAPAAAPAAQAASDCAPPIASLAELLRDPDPWMHQEANSEQRQPIYLGASPREMALGLTPADGHQPRLPAFLKERGELQLSAVRQALIRSGRLGPADPVDFETWPVRDDTGRLVWAVARWRLTGAPAQSWTWLNRDLLAPESLDPMPMLPLALSPANPQDEAQIFSDILELPGLYDKPAFGDCLWTGPGDSAALSPDTPAWLPTASMAFTRAQPPAPLCRVTPQPVRVSGKPATWIIPVTDSGPAWPAEFAWKPVPEEFPAPPPRRVAIRRWPATFRQAYVRDVLILDGEQEARFPLSERTARFTRKNNISVDNQLSLLVDYLEERHQLQGLVTFRQNLVWRGQTHTNLIAVIPGTDPELSQKPVLMADHIDTAFCEDTYAATGERHSAPGADDNVSATATLLRAAEILKAAKPKREIWLVHFTGEEFPADDLGARAFVAELMAQKRDITGLVLMDMIGWRQRGDSIFQINPGEDPASLGIAALALDAAHSLGAPGPSGLTPVPRVRFDEKSYLYNTDGLIFSDNGYPVVLLNEHMNRLENLERWGYHHTVDHTGMMHFPSAELIAKIAIETAARLAGGTLP